jgi:hypothetical protein
MRRHLIYNIVCLLLLTACEHEIPYNGEYQDGKLLVEAYTCAGVDSLVCCIGRTYFILDDKPFKPEVLDGLDIALEGTSGTYKVISDSTAGRTHYMKLSRPVQGGDELKLTVSHPQFGTAVAKEKAMPDFVPVSFSYERKVTTQGWDNHIVKMQLPGYPLETVIGLSAMLYMTQTVIRAVYDQEHTQTGWDTIVRPLVYTGPLFSYDPLFANLENSYLEGQGYYASSQKGGLLFMRADYPAGKQIEVYMHTMADKYYQTGQVTYQVDSFLLGFEMKSEAYYLYQASMENYLKAHRENDGEADRGELFSSIGMEETVSVYSNVENGYGAFISKTKTQIRIK